MLLNYTSTKNNDRDCPGALKDTAFGIKNVQCAQIIK